MKKFIISLVVLVGIIQLPTFGQSGFAGPDKKLTKAGCVDEGEEVCVSIGTENESESCYEWTPATGLKDPKSGITDACPDMTTDYKLTKTSPDGSVHVDYVKVEVITNVESIEAKPKNCCHMDGDHLSVDKFEFSPTGLEKCITLLTSNAVYTDGSDEQTVDFKYEGKDGKVINFSCQIKVAPNYSGSLGGVSPSSAKNLREVKNLLNDFLSGIQDIKDQCDKIKMPNYGREKPSYGDGKRLDWDYSLGLGTNCCNKCTDDYYGVELSYTFGGKYSFEVQGDWVLFGIPYVASAGMTFGVGASFAVTAKGAYTFYCSEGSLSLPIKLSAGVFGGLYAQIGNKWFNVVRAELTINGGAELGWTISIYPSFDMGWDKVSLCFDVKLVGKIEYLSLSSKSVDYLLGKTCWK